MDGCHEKEKYHYKIYIHIHPTRNYSDGQVNKKNEKRSQVS
jgi:hypothetical protein